MLKKLSSISVTTIVLINLVLKLAFFFSISPWDKKVEQEKIVVSDSKQYTRMEENILKYHSFAPQDDTLNPNHFSDYWLSGYLPLHVDTYRTPVYPLFMAAIYFIAGVKPYLVILIQILLSLFSVVLVYKIALLLSGRIEIAKFASLLFALDIHTAFVANQLLTDTLFLLTILASIYWLLKGLKKGWLRYITFSALLMGIAALIRPVALFYPLILLFLLFVFSKQSVSWKIKSSVLYLLIFSCCLGSWAYRNHAEYGRWQLSTEDGSGILMYYAAYTEARITHTNVDSVRIKFQRQADLLGFKNERNTFNQANIYKRVAFDYINKNRKEYIITHLLGGLNMFLALGNTGMAQTLGWDEDKHGETFAEISMKRILSNFTAHKREALLGVLILLVLIIEYAGALYGLLIVWRDKNYLFILLFLLTATYFALTTGVVGTYRYKLPVVPFICIAAGYGYMKLGKTSEKKV